MPKANTVTGIELKLIGTDGNAFALLGKAVGALRRNGFKDRVKEFTDDATSGDYNHLLAVMMKWFEVE